MPEKKTLTQKKSKEESSLAKMQRNLRGMLSGGEAEFQCVGIWPIWVFHLVMVEERQRLQGIAFRFPLQQTRGAPLTFPRKHLDRRWSFHSQLITNLVEVILGHFQRGVEEMEHIAGVLDPVLGRLLGGREPVVAGTAEVLVAAGGVCLNG